MHELKLPEIKAEKLKELLKKDFEDCIAEVVEAVDTAKAGSIIDDSEVATKSISKGFTDENGCGSSRFFPLARGQRRKISFGTKASSPLSIVPLTGL